MHSPESEAYAPECEIRFATVIYGGVSLAIYINGIVQEMLHMVRSTAADDKSQTPIPWQNLTPVERIYRTLSTMVGRQASHATIKKEVAGPSKTYNHRPGTAVLVTGHASRTGVASPADTIDRRLTASDHSSNPIRTRFVVDILSGTSAGGINAIFLAKALAGNLSLKSVAQMWIVDADLDNLLNDKKIQPSFLRQNPPDALLNARWMYRELLIALQGMNLPHLPGEPSDLVDDLDLYCTTTDLGGIAAKIPLADETVEEKRYRNFYHFERRIGKVRGAGTPQSGLVPTAEPDDLAGSDPFLAFAARCTSSFPFAFEPMELQDAFEIVKSDPKFGEYLSQVTDPAAKELFGADAARLQGAEKFARICSIYADPDLLSGPGPSFADRPFGDGGYLDNKPFTYAIETIKKRHATLPVDRKLIYIEPSPESISAAQPAPANGKAARPNVVENSLDALVVLPRYETIRQDIENVLNWNADIARLHRVLDHFEEEIANCSSENIGNIDHTLAYDSYWRLRLSGAADQLAACLAEGLGVDSSSAEGQAMRSIVGTWRENRFGAVAVLESSKKDLRDRQQRFLDLFDFDFCERKIRFLRTHLQRLPNQSARMEFSPKLPPQSPLTRLAEITLEFTSLLNDTPDIALQGAAQKCWDQYLQFIVDPKFAASALGYALSGEIAPGSAPISHPNSEFLSVTDAGRDSRVGWLMKSPQSVKVLSAETCGCKNEDLIEFSKIVDKVAQTVVGHYAVKGVTYNPAPQAAPLEPPEGETRLQRIDREMATLLELVHVPKAQQGKGPRSGEEFFQAMDVLVYPIVFGTELGEFETVEIFRISPRDTRPIAGTLPGSEANQDVNPPLCGDALWAFGAFLDQRWRLSDMLRGRLDGAERLITAILPDSDPETVSVRERLICMAQEAIAAEWSEFEKPYVPAAAQPETQGVKQ
jgi:patatin-related protein